MFPSLQAVPSAGSWQPAFPSHLPVFPHVFVLVGQVLTAGSRGAVPAAMLVQVPTLPDRAHDWQPPVHEVSQHSPVASAACVFTQWACAQSPSDPQVAPGASLSPHLFVWVLQVTPEAQSEPLVQVVRQVAPLVLQA
jgi:hypothetical protein